LLAFEDPVRDGVAAAVAACQAAGIHVIIVTGDVASRRSRRTSWATHLAGVGTIGREVMIGANTIVPAACQNTAPPTGAKAIGIEKERKGTSAGSSLPRHGDLAFIIEASVGPVTRQQARE